MWPLTRSCRTDIKNKKIKQTDQPTDLKKNKNEKAKIYMKYNSNLSNIHYRIAISGNMLRIMVLNKSVKEEATV